jgi:hypothetical protein
VPLPLGEAVELQHDANVIRQHRDLDLAAQAAQAQRASGDRGALCTQAGCLHQVYVSTGGRYRLLRSYYAQEGD